MAVFKENLTSRLLQKHSIDILNNKLMGPKNVLELGCGDGNISKYLIDNQKFNNNFFLSDISTEAINVAKNNIEYNNVVFKIGSIFEPWVKSNLKFDVIISDVSSISEPVAKKSPWYNGVVSDCDIDGIKNIKIILEDINRYININGYFIIPIISLCNLKKLDRLLNEKFSNISYSEKVNWPIPDFFKNNIINFQSLIDLKDISVEYKFGSYLAFTCVAVCSKLKV